MIKPLSVTDIQELYGIDKEGFIRLALNSLLILEDDRVVLIDPGCAEFLPARIMKDYGLEIKEPIESILEKKGVTATMVTDVVFTHLHFDHGSGAFVRKPGTIAKRFPNARYHVWKEHFEYSSRPHPSESNSFFTSFFRYIDQVYWLEDWTSDWMNFKIFHGHTIGMLIPVINSGNETIYYLSDLIPMQVFLKQEVWCGYDLDPDLAKSEKVEFLRKIRNNNTKLLFLHDPLIDSINYP